MSGLTNIPSLDALVADPSKAVTLSPEAAQALLLGMVSIQPILIQRALIGPQPEQRETKSNPTLLTAQQVAARLNVKKSFVYELARQKKLKSVKLGDKYVQFTEAAVREFLVQGGA